MNDAAREQGFGTGLLAHLERGRGLLPELDVQPAVEPTQPVPKPEVRPDRRPDPFAERERTLAERERLLAEREAEFLVASATLALREERLREAPPVEGPPPEYIRARAEREVARVWTAFSEGLAATTPDGRPDHATRIAAAQALLAELRLDPPTAAFADELARRRELREAGL